MAIPSKTTAIEPKHASEMKAFEEKIEKFSDTIRGIAEFQKNARKTVREQMNEIIHDGKRLGIDDLQIRWMIVTSLEARNVHPSYIRKLLPEKLKSMQMSRTKKIGQVQRQPLEVTSTDQSQRRIEELQAKITSLENECDRLGEPFVARGFVSTGNSSWPIKVRINPRTKSIEEVEIDDAVIHMIRKLLKKQE